jgi:flagellar FliL protein
MKILTPLLLALLGLAAGVGAGVATKPAPAPEAADLACAAPEAAPPAPDAPEAAPATPCPPPDLFAAAAEPERKPASDLAYVKPASDLAYVTMDKPFVVPVFADEAVTAMVVVSLSVETELDAAPVIESVKPRLRDSFLKAMFRHANSGGFDGSYTSGQKMQDLKSALRAAAQEVLPDTPVGEVLITEIARQDV